MRLRGAVVAGAGGGKSNDRELGRLAAGGGGPQQRGGGAAGVGALGRGVDQGLVDGCGPREQGACRRLQQRLLAAQRDEGALLRRRRAAEVQRQRGGRLRAELVASGGAQGENPNSYHIVSL